MHDRVALQLHVPQSAEGLELLGCLPVVDVAVQEEAASDAPMQLMPLDVVQTQRQFIQRASIGRGTVMISLHDDKAAVRMTVGKLLDPFDGGGD